MNIVVHNFQNKDVVEKINVDLTSIEECKVNEKFLNAYFVRMDAAFHAERKAKTKNQSEISGTTAKPHKQKGTGNARQGSKRAAQHRGGGTMFGPRGLTRKVLVPKKETQLAKRMLLSLALKNDKIFVVENHKLSDGKTKTTINSVGNYCDKNKPNCLLVSHEVVDGNNLLGARNVRGIKYANVKTFTVQDLIKSDAIVISKDALIQLSSTI